VIIIVHKTNKAKVTSNLPTSDSNKQSFGIHKSKSWLEEVDQSLREKEKALAKHEKQLEEAEMEKAQRSKLLEKMTELETERAEIQREKEAMEIEREAQQERTLKLAEKEEKLIEAKPKEPLMPKLKEEFKGVMKVGKRVAKVPEKLFFDQKKKTKKIYKEAGIEVV